ncbi:MAG: hypothetical protein J6A25_11755 [Lachnospiraceae bacterium]|nr:hypothetical protein [Lachnospiraceae bacterium]
MTKIFNKIKLIVSVYALLCLVLNYSLGIVAAEITDEPEDGEAYFESVEFVPMDDGEDEEMLHLLFAKLSYDCLDEYEGFTVEEYISAHPDLYGGEIWEESGITYEAMYNSIVGDWTILDSYNKNDTSGFYGVAFEKEGKIIIAYRGSEMFTEEFALNESNDWIGTDFQFALFNELSSQFQDARDFLYIVARSTKADNKSIDNITITGHSLGGALVAYVSMTEGVVGYSYDGACGHVIDLIYYTEYLNIEDLIGTDDKVLFCNYTDDTGYSIADLIQHTNASSLYQIDRETNVDGLVENDFIPQLADADSHIIWSTLQYEDNRVYFTPKVGADDKGYTYVPNEITYLDINKNVLEAGLEEIDIPSYFGIGNNSIDYEYVLGALTGIVKDGRVVLGSNEPNVFALYDDIGISSSFNIENIAYGGTDSDVILGYVSDDVFIGGAGNDYMHGNLGNDTYVVNADSTGAYHICDIGGEKTSIVLKDMHIRSLDRLEYSEELGGFSLPTGQNLFIEVAQTYDNVDIYAFDEGKLYYIGNLAQTTYPGVNRENAISVFANSYMSNKNIVMLEGVATIDIYDQQGNVVESVMNTGDEGEGVLELASGAAYYNCSDYSHILLVVNQGYNIEITSEGRCDLAIGEYSDTEGIVGCKREYYRKYDGHTIDFEEVKYTDHGSGEVHWQDVLHAGINVISSLFD